MRMKETRIKRRRFRSGRAPRIDDNRPPTAIRKCDRNERTRESRPDHQNVSALRRARRGGTGARRSQQPGSHNIECFEDPRRNVGLEPRGHLTRQHANARLTREDRTKHAERTSVFENKEVGVRTELPGESGDGHRPEPYGKPRAPVVILNRHAGDPTRTKPLRVRHRQYDPPSRTQSFSAEFVGARTDALECIEGRCGRTGDDVQGKR